MTSSQTKVWITNEYFQDFITEVDETLNFCYTTLKDSPGSFSELMQVVQSHFEVYLRYPELSKKIVEDTFNLVSS